MIQQTYQIFGNKLKLNFIIAFCIALFILVNVVLDFSFTLFQNSSFYISESLLFGTYWLLYLFLPKIISKINRIKKFELKLLFIISAILSHLFAYPALVWIISKLFYSHTFAYWQTFNFGISAYLIKTVLIYGFSFIVFTLLNKKIQASQNNISIEKEKKVMLQSILVSDSQNKKLLLQVNDIFYFSATPPYVSIFHSSKKHLLTETLKSLELQLDNMQFVRIHKSHIINIHKIASIQSRQNGDYDVTLLDNTILRVSRHYAKNFKSKFEQLTQLGIK